MHDERDQFEHALQLADAPHVLLQVRHAVNQVVREELQARDSGELETCEKYEIKFTHKI